jgi:hypothetical protein
MNMKKCKKKILNLLLMMLTIVLFNCIPVSASELDATNATIEATTETTTEVTTEVATETAVKVATPGDAWYTTLVGSPDGTPKTLDDIYVLLHWILIFLVTFIICVAFVFIYNCLM